MHKKITIALIVLLPLVLCAVLGENITPYDPCFVDLDKKLLPSSAEHILGTDHLGRDVFSRLIVGTRSSLSAVFFCMLLLVGCSVPLGCLCGYMGGRIDAFVMRICDAMMVFPTIILALFLIGVLGTGLTNLIVAIAITHMAWYTRFVRSHVLTIKHSGYIMAAKAMGVSKVRIVWRHILPAVLVQVMVLASLDVGHMLLHVAGLSFLGLGVQPPMPEWGVMIAEARHVMRTAPLLMLYPGLMIFMTTAACNFLGDALRDFLDPQ